MSSIVLPSSSPSWIDRLRHGRFFRGAVARAAAFGDIALWKIQARVEQFDGQDIDEYRAHFGKEEGEARFFHDLRPSRSVVTPWNMLMYGGASLLWECLIGNGTGTAGQATTFLNAAQAALGVGDSATAEAATQNNLLASTNAFRQVLDSGFPLHTDGLVVGSATITMRSTIGTTNANFVWNEWGMFNSVGAGSPPSGGRMVNRKVAPLGTKTSAGSWAFFVTSTLA